MSFESLTLMRHKFNAYETLRKHIGLIHITTDMQLLRTSLKWWPMISKSSLFLLSMEIMKHEPHTLQLSILRNK